MGDLSLRTDADPVAKLDALVATMTAQRFLAQWRDDALAGAAARTWADRIAPRVRHVEVCEADPGTGHLDGHVGGCGDLWLVRNDDELSVLALRLDDPALATEVRDLVAELAREEGCRRLSIGVVPGESGSETFAGDGFEVAADQMCLDLDGDLSADTVVALVPMGEDDYALWEADEVETYALAREKAGEPRETALRIATEQHAELLSDGLATAHHHFFVGRVDGEEVGTLWIGTERPMAFVYDVTIHETQRRRGYGAGLMRAGALWAQAQGAPAVGLNVFGYNRGAKALYDRLGYRVVESYRTLTL